MPYAKKQWRFKWPQKSGSAARKRGVARRRPAAAQMALIQRSVDRKIHHHGMSDFSSITNAWCEHDMVADIVCGTAINNRIGNDIVCETLEASFTVASAEMLFAGDAYNTIRICVAWFAKPHIPATDTEYFRPFTDKLHEKVYPEKYPGLIRVLYDKIFVLKHHLVSDTAYYPAARCFKIYIPLRGEKIKFTNGSALSNDKQLMVAMTSDSSALPNPGVVTGQMTLRFAG